MITHIRMKNFKSWEDSDKVELAPLTGFFGTNSSGKSSLLQMLLLLKQSIDRDQTIFFGDGNSLVNLGSFREVIHGHKAKEKLELEFGCTIQNPFTIKISDEAIDIDSFIFDISIREASRSPVVENICYTVGAEGNHKIVCQNGEIYYRNPQNPEANYRLGHLSMKSFYGSPESGLVRALEAVQGFSFAFEKTIFAYLLPRPNSGGSSTGIQLVRQPSSTY